MPSLVIKLSRLISLLLLFFVSAGLFAYAWWLFQLESGNRAVHRGDAKTASRMYASAETPFLRAPWLARLVSDDYRKLVFNRVSILYGEGNDAEVVKHLEDKAARAPFISETAEYSFWMGNALMRQAMRSKNAESAANSLKAALAEYQRGLAAHPGEWDLKYNFELVRQVLSRRGLDKASEEEEQEDLKSVLDKLQPQKNQMDKWLPPEKRG